MKDTLEDAAVEQIEAVSELKCNANHHFDGEGVEHACTITAVGIIIFACSPGRTAYICQPLVDITLAAFRDLGICADCKQFVSQCWSLTPIL